MGSGSSFPPNDEFDLSDEPGVVKRIPIEMNPRRTFGGALRSVGSLGWRPRGVSLRSTFSVELDNTEVEKVRKEFETYKITKQAEMGGSLKKVKKLENENRRLRAELQALQKTCDKLRTQRDVTLDAEYQALERASSFETERNRVQKQFKIFRESKESEIRALLKAKEKMERALHHIDPEALSEMKGKELTDEANRFQELWPSLQSESSISSSTQLLSLQRTFDAVEVEGYPATNRAVWSELPSLAFAQTFNPFLCLPSLIRVYVSVSPDLSRDVLSLLKVRETNLRYLCETENRFLSVVCFSRGMEDEEIQFMNIHEVRQNEIKQCNIFVAIVSNLDRVVEEDLYLGCTRNPGERKTLCLFHDVSEATAVVSQQIKSDGLALIIGDGGVTLEDKLKLLFLELEKFIKQELGQDTTSETTSNISSDLTGGTGSSGALWDLYGENEQQQALVSALDCVCELGMSKLYDRLNEHILSAGPLPPLLVLGGAGSGKSLLLAKWLSNHIKRNPSCLVLYHLVGSPSSSSAVVVDMIQRLTAQIMQIVAPSQKLTSDPSRLLDEFPHWLEKVSTKLPDGVVLVVDSGDRFQNCEDDLAWLLDPLPVESRVIISAQVETCPKVWRSWPVLEIGPLSDGEVSEFLQMSCLKEDSFLSEDLERQILQRCKKGGCIIHPLYLTVLMSSLLCNLRWGDEEITECLDCPDTVQLYQYLICDILGRYREAALLIRKALQLILVSQNGIPESVLFTLIPDLTWNTWAPVYQELKARCLLSVTCGLVNYTHEKAKAAVQLMFSPVEELCGSQDELTEYYINLLRSNQVTYHICDELLGLLHTSGDLPLLRECVSHVDVFRIMYTRGRYAKLLNCWQAIGFDRLSVCKEYFEIIRRMEEAAAANDTPCPDVADLFEMVGKFSKELGLLNQAVWAFQRALEIRESIDPDDASVGRCFYLLGSLHVQWGKVATAESYFKQALSIWEMCEGSCQQWVTKALDSLAILYKRQGKYNVVESLMKKSAILKKEVASHDSNSQSQRGQGNIKKRIQVLQAQCQKLEGIPLAEALCDLGVLFLWQQDFVSAKEHLMQGINTMERLHSVRTPGLLQPLGTLANVHETEGDLEQAERAYLRMLDICKKMPEKDGPMENIAARNLGALYKKQGKFEKAERLYKDSIKKKEASLGNDHPNVATDLLNLAILHCQQENHAHALPLFERALNILENSYGPRHPRVAEILRNLAVLHFEIGNEQRAAELYERASEIKETANISGGSRLASRRSSITSVAVSRTTSEK